MKPGMCLLFLTVSMAVMSTVSAQSSCTDVLISMAPCLGYITGNSSSPSQQCCSQLAHVIRSSGECLCEVLKGGGPHLGINFNKTQALALPKACNVQTPPVSRCNGPSNTSEHGNGSKTVPGHRSSSRGSSIKVSFSLLAVLSAVSYIINYSRY
ncbi:non-specific lipid transfer protein GPI-anchored 26-like isoform X2 [Brassica napus]|uniref:non-specific lipid-transfer protein-like protein At2g13820 isoform X2 n=1 Tax=Brassica oleracea var. oleracea TaxID=109376 RepID=UPI0006A6FAA4|nr:PREDICTED: non-specific lipid-transfer protein-like protein At2g13820 isoform X2 [Brassica oleracea var. oleracea]XP_022550626.1 non-specific lipid transfer protein GPI-anchored 26-like isoform X2 [Brassica napus]